MLLKILDVIMPIMLFLFFVWIIIVFSVVIVGYVYGLKIVNPIPGIAGG